MPWWNPTRLVLVAFVVAGCLGTAALLAEPGGSASAGPGPAGRPGASSPQESTGLPEPGRDGVEEPPPKTQPGTRNATPRPSGSSEGVVRFLAWGDTGHGSPEQYRTAESARQVCARKGCDFILQLGDNIYNTGVSSPQDPQWRTKFEQPYANLSLPFHAVLGNHDVATPNADGTGDNGDQQVAYDDQWGGPSAKWNMPARNYTFRDGPAAFWALDLTALADRSALDSGERAQARSLGSSLDASSATWRFAFAHFPYVSNGEHGSAGRYDGVRGSGGAVKEYLEAAVCGRADLYLAAHDHDLEWLQAVPACGATEFIVSGAASEPNPVAFPPREPVHFSRGNQLGFFWFEVDGDTLTGRAYDVSGTMIHERVLRK